MASRHVGNLVSQRAGKLVLVASQFDEPGVDEHVPARKGKRIHLLAIDHAKCERHFGVRVARQILPHAVDIFGENGIVVNLRFARHFVGQLFAPRHFLVDGIEVETLADIAVADLAGIVLLVLPIGGRCPGGQGDRQDGRGEKSHGWLPRPL